MFSSSALPVKSIPFPFKSFSLTLIAIVPYFFWLGYSGFPPLFYNFALCRIFPSPSWGIVCERLPSTQVPYDLRDTLGYFAANKPL